MGDETKAGEVRRGNEDPLHATRKSSTADSVAEEPADVAQMPTREEIERREEGRRRP